MPSFRTRQGRRDPRRRGRGSSACSVDLGDGPERAYVLTQLTGPVAVGDRVVVNTTAVELGLGTGGWHVVHWNLARDGWSDAGPRPRHQAALHEPAGRRRQCRGARERSPTSTTSTACRSWSPRCTASSPAVAVAFKHVARPAVGSRYVMTDGAALPIALSDLVCASCATADLIDATVTCGHAFGGDHEAVSVPSAPRGRPPPRRRRRRRRRRWARASSGPAPGSASPASRSARCSTPPSPSAVRPIAALRVVVRRPRAAPPGVSHHTITTLRLACRDRVDRRRARGRAGRSKPALLRDLGDAGIDARHDLVMVEPPDVLPLLGPDGLDIVSMGRPAATDAIMFQRRGRRGHRSRPAWVTGS